MRASTNDDAEFCNSSGVGDAIAEQGSVSMHTHELLPVLSLFNTVVHPL
jgi:hypothetical protein